MRMIKVRILTKRSKETIHINKKWKRVDSLWFYQRHKELKRAVVLMELVLYRGLAQRRQLSTISNNR